MLCSGAHFIDLPGFDGDAPAQPPAPPNRRSISNSKSEDSSFTDEEQRISELDKPLTNGTIVINMLGYKGDVHQTTLDKSDIEIFNDLVSDDSDSESNSEEMTTRYPHPPLRRRMNGKYSGTQVHARELPDRRRHWLVSETPLQTTELTRNPMSEDKDSGLKTKILTLVQQTMHDTDTKIRATKSIKDKYRDRAPYRIGFILSMVKKSRDVLNELFNVAVKHRDEWKALEQLKIFELIVHTNVDTTNLVRQLVELHINNLNTTQRKTRLRLGQTTKQRVVIL